MFPARKEKLMNSENYLEPNSGLAEDKQIEFERKIISSCIGVDSDGIANCSVTSMLMIYHPNEKDVNEQYEVLSSYSYLYPDFNLEINGNFAQADIHFPEHNEKAEQELAILWRQLEEYGQLVKDLDGVNRVASVLFCIMPNLPDMPEYEGTHLAFVNPIFRTLSPVSPTENVSTVKMLVLTDNFTINTPPSNIDIEKERANFNRVQTVRERETLN